MFKGYDPDRKPPYEHVVYYIVKGKTMKTTYSVARGYADSISITSNSEYVKNVPDNANVEVSK